MEKRLIDAKNAISILKILSDKCCDDKSFEQAISVLESVPTIDAVEVVHGEWIPFQRPNGGYYTGCSICSFPMPTDSMCDFMDETDNRFCYNCGAKMDGKEKSDE